MNADDLPELLAATAAHELLGPLVSIEAYARLAREQANTATVDGELDAIALIALRTRRLVEMLLHELRPDGRPLTRTDVRLEDVVADAIAASRPEARLRGVVFEVGPLPTVAGDPDLLHGLFTNLVANAVKHGPDWGGSVTIAAERASDGGTVVRVSNTGDPLDEDDAADIFEPFRRGTNGAAVAGHGLGLTLCRRIAEHHGGGIHVATEPGGRTVFAVSLPPAPAASAAS